MTKGDEVEVEVEEKLEATTLLASPEISKKWEFWHLLPRSERKEISLQAGMKTIGEFEEFMTLHEAEALSGAPSINNNNNNNNNNNMQIDKNKRYKIDEKKNETVKDDIDSVVDKVNTLLTLKGKNEQQSSKLKDEDTIEHLNIKESSNPRASIAESKTNKKLSSSNNEKSSSSAPIIVRDEWELTWPIWHLLPWAERKQIAIDAGMKSIGEFEEFMILHRTETVSNAYNVSVSQPYSNQSIYVYDNEDEKEHAEDEHESSYKKNGDLDLESDDDEEIHNGGKHEQSEPEVVLNPELPSEADLELGGLIVQVLPEEILHGILSFLDVEYYSLCALVHRSWGFFTKSEHAYQKICQRCYLTQSKRKALNVKRFQNSYRNMLMRRPRLRTQGLYVLKYAQVKKIQRDMWTEIPVGAVLETVYYRYLNFLEDGRVIYGLTTDPPQVIIRRIRQLKADPGREQKDLVWGRYQVSKYDVKVRARHPWCNVMLDLEIIPSTKNSGIRGKFCHLRFVKHVTNSDPEFELTCFSDNQENYADNWWSNIHGAVEHKVPEEYFRFVRNWKL